MILIYRVVWAYQSRSVLQFFQGFSHKFGHTFTFWIQGNRNLVTPQPENVKTILASSFEVFDYGPSRRFGYEPLLGDRIVAADGAKWTETRALLRPSFAKSRICDVEMFERHFQAYLKAPPAEDGVATDLQELFKQLSMDIITDMLFGSSTNTITQTESDERGFMTLPTLASILKRSFGGTLRSVGLALFGLTRKTAGQGGCHTRFLINGYGELSNKGHP